MFFTWLAWARKVRPADCLSSDQSRPLPPLTQVRFSVSADNRSTSAQPATEPS